MKQKYYYLIIMLAGLCSCVVHEQDLMERTPASRETIRFLMTTSTRAGVIQTIGNRRFSPTVLLLLNNTGSMQLNTFNSNTTGSTPYMYRVDVAGHIDDYVGQLYDTGYPYLVKDGTDTDANTLHAVGFSPGGSFFTPRTTSTGADYRQINVNWAQFSDAALYQGRIDFLSLDSKDAFAGSVGAKFNNTSSQLVFRHLTSKIRFVATRSADMFNTQYVRDVQITNVRLCYAASGVTPTAQDSTWEKFCAPTQLTWKPDAGEAGIWGYVRTAMAPLPDAFTLKIFTTSPVTIERDLPIDSMYVCNHFNETGDIKATGAIYLKMDVRALISHLATFPGAGEDNGLTYHRDWTNLIVPLRTANASGYVQKLVDGEQYTVRLKFVRNGLYLDGQEEEWHDGGTHDIIINPNQ